MPGKQQVFFYDITGVYNLFIQAETGNKQT